MSIGDGEPAEAAVPPTPLTETSVST